MSRRAARLFLSSSSSFFSPSSSSSSSSCRRAFSAHRPCLAGALWTRGYASQTHTTPPSSPSSPSSTISKEEVHRVGKEMMEERQQLGIPHLIQVFGKMKTKEDRLQDVKKRLEQHKDKPNPHHALLEDYAKWGRTEMVEEAYGMMREQGYPFSVETYNYVLWGYCTAGQMDKAERTLEEMKKKGFLPDQTSSLYIIGGYAKSNQDEKAMETLKLLDKEIVTEDMISHVVDVLARNVMMEKALTFINDARHTYNKHPNNEAYCSLIEGFARVNDVPGMEKVLSDMKRHGVIPHLRVYNTLMLKVGKAGDFARALELFKSLKDDGFVPDKETYNILIDLCDQHNDLKKAYDILREMKLNGITPSGTTLGSLEALSYRNQRMDLFKEHCGNEFYVLNPPSKE